MTPEQLAKVKAIVARAAIYVKFNDEGVRISYWDTDEEIEDTKGDWDDDSYTGRFYGIGEESGEEVDCAFAEVDLDKDLFYEIKLIA
jgi:hypothetical protein